MFDCRWGFGEDGSDSSPVVCSGRTDGAVGDTGVDDTGVDDTGVAVVLSLLMTLLSSTT